jgi:elongation factor P hydroxylase
MSSAGISCSSAIEPFRSARLEKVFNICFADSMNTQLVGGAEEPLYQPAATPIEHHALYYRADYFASALHEVAHWCIAGERRRLQTDFGYWYAPDGRNLQQQRAFQAVESRPQALEWYFSKACDYRFQVSLDNLGLPDSRNADSSAFQRSVLLQARHWKQTGLPGRAATFFQALCREFGTNVPARKLAFSLAELL